MKNQRKSLAYSCYQSFELVSKAINFIATLKSFSLGESQFHTLLGGEFHIITNEDNRIMNGFERGNLSNYY